MQRPIAIIFVFMSLIPVGDAAWKLMTDANSVSPIFVAWSRFTVGVICLFPIAFKDKKFFDFLLDWWISIRAFVLVIGITSILQVLSSAAITKVYYIFLVARLSAIFLQLWRDFLWIFLTMSHALRDRGKPFGLKFFQLLFGAIAFMPFVLFYIPDFTLQISVLAFISGVVSMLGNLLLIIAYTLACATRLASLSIHRLLLRRSLVSRSMDIGQTELLGLVWVLSLHAVRYRQPHGSSPLRSALEDKWLIGRLT